MSTGAMRAKARDLQAAARRLPLARAPRAVDRAHFVGVGREIMWGLTLNK